MRLALLLGLVACGPVPLDGPGALAGVRLADGPAAGVDVEVSPDGAIWVGWVEDGRYRLASSSDGRGFSPGEVALEVPVTASLARRPRLAVSEDRVAVVLSDGITADARVLLAVADRSGGGGFDTIVLDAIDPSADGLEPDTLDQPTVTFTADGELVASWKIGLDHDYAVVVARESAGFAPEVATGFPGQPCECCPHELYAVGGELLLLQRSNQANLREIHLGRQADDGFEVARVSENGWVVAGCPFDGPRLAPVGGDLVVTWMDATPGRGTAWVARSEDGGRTWTDGVAPLAREVEQAFPGIASDGDRVWLTVEALFASTWLLESDDGGRTWSAGEEIGLVGVDVAPGALAGVDPGGAVWFVPR